ncbi:peptidoglycan-associated lipoprotein Pal [Endozoicomonadaceae bacterium StTr2]
MQMHKYARSILLASAMVWVAGCASTGGNSAGQVDNEAKPVEVITEEEVVVMPVIDPAVQAVIDTGKISASAEEIEGLLQQNEYHFPFDSSELKDRDYQALDVQAAYLTSSRGAAEKIVIEGHTDERGTRTYNLALGERRANAVKRYLVLKGVAADRIEVISYGFERPVDPAHNETAWAQNRRAIIVRGN